MADGEFNSLVNYQALGYYAEEIPQSLNLWPRAEFLEPHEAIRSDRGPAHRSGDIEQLYTVLHNGVDQVVAELSASIPPRLDRIRELNRRLIDKLTTLDTTITTDPRAPLVRSRPRADSSSPASEEDRARRACKKRRVSQSTATRKSPGLQDQLQDHGYGTASGGGGLVMDSRLASKLVQVGNDETRAQAAEFATKLKTHGSHHALPDSYQFDSMSQVTDVSHFRRVVLDLGLAIESSSFGEQNSRIKKRIALAHFYNAYTLAQSNPEIFLSWCDNQNVHGGSMPPRGGNKSVVQARFADLIFSQTGENMTASSDRPLNAAEEGKRRNAKIQMWRKSGKKWAQVIQRFGYGILLLLPASLSDEDLRITNDKELACGLDLIDSRKYLFADVLQQANRLLNAHFFPQNRHNEGSNARESGRLEGVDWSSLLHAPARAKQGRDNAAELERLERLDLLEFEQLYQTGITC